MLINLNFFRRRKKKAQLVELSQKFWEVYNVVSEPIPADFEDCAEIAIKLSVHRGTSLIAVTRAGCLFHEVKLELTPLKFWTKWHKNQKNSGRDIPTMPTINRYIYLYKNIALVHEAYTRHGAKTIRDAMRFIRQPQVYRNKLKRQGGVK